MDYQVRNFFMIKTLGFIVIVSFTFFDIAQASEQINSLECNEYFKSKFGQKLKENGFKKEGRVSIDLKGKKSIFFAKSSSVTDHKFNEWIDIDLEGSEDRIAHIEYHYGGHYGLRNTGDENIQSKINIDLGPDCLPKSIKLTSGHNTIAELTPKFCQKKFPCAKTDVSEYSPEALNGENNGLCEKGIKHWNKQDESRVPKLTLYSFDLKRQKGYLKDTSKQKSLCFSNQNECILTEESVKSFVNGTNSQINQRKSGSVLHLRNNRKYFPEFQSFDHITSPLILNFVHSYIEMCNFLRDEELSPLADEPAKNNQKKSANVIEM